MLELAMLKIDVDEFSVSRVMQCVGSGLKNAGVLR